MSRSQAALSLVPVTEPQEDALIPVTILEWPDLTPLRSKIAQSLMHDWRRVRENGLIGSPLEFCIKQNIAFILRLNCRCRGEYCMCGGDYRPMPGDMDIANII